MSSQDPITIDHAKLRLFASAIFQAANVDSDEADVVAESLVESNLCGHDSHGVVRVSEYIGLLEKRELRSGVELQVMTETPALLACDGGLGFGQVHMRRLLKKLVPKARENGVVTGTVRNCGHIGRLAEWVEVLARDGLAGILSVNDNGVLKCVAPPGGIEPRISTNPLAIGVPTGNEPLVLDISTSVVANGKIRVAQVSGSECPDGWLLDSEGRPTNNPNDRFTDPPGSILPMGGYKGFGLGLLLDVLIGGLSGGQCPPASDGSVECNNVLLVVFDPEQFHGADAFRREADRLIEFVRSSPLQHDADAIRLPGDRSAALRKQRIDSGVPIDSGTWSELCRAAAALNVAPPN